MANYNLLIDQTKQIGEREKDNYTLKLGYLRDFDTSEFLQAVTEFSKKYPEVKVRIHSGNREELFRLLRDDRIDLNFSDLRRALEYCRTVLGIESNFKLVETYDEALMQVISGADIF